MKPFLAQDRPKKVKEIYRALKRDHPDMPAELKARIASRQGKPGKQKQGPPYKAKLTTTYRHGSWVKTAEKLVGGLADHKPDSAFSSTALKKGVKVEMEHTNDPEKAKEVAKDHLTENPRYYDMLAKMEKSMNKTAFLAAGPGNPDPEAKERDEERAKKNRESRRPFYKRVYDRLDQIYRGDEHEDSTGDSAEIEKDASVDDVATLLLEAVGSIPSSARKKKKKKKEVPLTEQHPVTKSVFDSTLERATKRLLPGAKLIRSGRPMTDILKKIKKKQRRALNSEYFKYRSKVVKAPQKALVNTNRAQAQKAYKR